jgi:hypothetical protein
MGRTGFRSRAALRLAATLGMIAGASGRAEAAFTFIMQQSGSNVAVTGGGTFNPLDLPNPLPGAPSTSFIGPQSETIRSSQAPGRDYVLLATDESAPGYYNFNNAPLHIVSVRTQDLKFGLYANWRGPTAQIADDGTLETELYDYSTAAGQAELDNISTSNPSDPRIPALEQVLLGNLIPNVLRAPLRGLLGAAQTASRAAYLAYDALLRNIPNNSCSTSSSTGDLLALLPFGKDF